MQVQIKATKRQEQGSSASRRLRRAGKLPGIIYGGEGEAMPITMDHNELFHMLKKEAFHSSLLSIDVDGKKETVVLRDSQWHAYKQQVLHLDFQRILSTEKIHMNVPLHFLNGETSPAVKMAGAIISHVMNEVEIICLPKDLPEFINIDLAKLENGQAIHLSEIKLPAGVELAPHGDADPVVVSALMARAETETSGEKGAEEGGGGTEA